MSHIDAQPKKAAIHSFKSFIELCRFVTVMFCYQVLICQTNAVGRDKIPDIRTALGWQIR